MDNIAHFILENVSTKLDEIVEESFMQCGMEMDMAFDDMCNVLFSIIDRSKMEELELLRENYQMQRATIISFKYQGRTCEIGEHYGSQRDYFWVTILPV